jgi:hypothetical protein
MQYRSSPGAEVSFFEFNFDVQQLADGCFALSGRDVYC